MRALWRRRKFSASREWPRRRAADLPAHTGPHPRLEAFIPAKVLDRNSEVRFDKPMRAAAIKKNQPCPSAGTHCGLIPC